MYMRCAWITTCISSTSFSFVCDERLKDEERSCGYKLFVG
jgi:hypothetical protein